MIKTFKRKEAIINFRTKETVKNKTNKIFNAVGLDMSSALNLFLHNVIITKGIPLNIVTQNGYTVQDELDMLSSSKDTANIKTYKNFNDLWKDLNG